LSETIPENLAGRFRENSMCASIQKRTRRRRAPREAVMAPVVGPSCRRAARYLATLALSIWLGIGAVACAQDVGAGDAGLAARASSSAAFSTLPAILKRKYPSVRAVVVARGACVVFEYYRQGIGVATRSPVHSITKSVLSVLIGIAIDKGYLRLDQKLSELLPEASEANIDPLVREIEVRDLLTMTAGFDPAAAGDYAPEISVTTPESWRWMLNRPMKYPPGSHFNYDTGEHNLASVVLTRAIKQDAGSFARRSLFEPLHIDNYNWTTDADGYLIGATSLSMTARDMAKIGALYLQHGRWGDRQIVSNAYVLDSTAKHSEGGPPSNAAYGYFWWRSKTRMDLDTFFAAGSGSQLIYVVPKLDLVVALAAESIPGGSVGFVNDIVLPAETNLPASAPCIVRFAQGRAE
jgi:CubicO group peptidase (beta-lactamase class C family)